LFTSTTASTASDCFHGHQSENFPYHFGGSMTSLHCPVNSFSGSSWIAHVCGWVTLLFVSNSVLLLVRLIWKHRSMVQRRSRVPLTPRQRQILHLNPSGTCKASPTFTAHESVQNYVIVMFRIAFVAVLCC
jgi:hypothetical protein